jgi:GcrA cell cycle regulator
MMHPWPAAATDCLREYWERGLSASQCTRAINEEFGTRFSRNAVIGKAYRLGLAKRGRGYRPPQAAAPMPSRPKRRLSNPAGPALAKPPAVASVASEPLPQAVTLAELLPHHCRWPFGDPRLPGFRFCGARRADHLPYCVIHARLAYRPATQKERAA